MHASLVYNNYPCPHAGSALRVGGIDYKSQAIMHYLLLISSLFLCVAGYPSC